MKPQYLGDRQANRREVASLTSHERATVADPFIFLEFSATFCRGYSQDTSYPARGPKLGQAGSFGSVVNEKKTRRLKCPRASKPWSRSASLHSSQPVHKNQKKSMWSHTQLRSLLSRHTPANTSNSFWGRLCAASKIPSCDSTQMFGSQVYSPKNLDSARFFNLNWSTWNNEGEEECAYTSRLSPRSIWSRAVPHRNQRRSQQSRFSTNLAITNVKSYRAPTSVSQMMTSRASWRMGQLHRQASNARRQQGGEMMTTVPRQVAVGQDQRARQGVHSDLTQITRPSGQISGSEGATC